MSFKKLTYIIVILFFVTIVNKGKCSINSDSIKLKNAVYGELLGTGVYYSLNYERTFFDKKKSSLNLRLGLNWHPFTPKVGGGSNFFAGINFKKELKKIYFLSIGFQPVFLITYYPIPNRNQMEIALNDPQNWGRPYNPFLQFSLNGSIGLGKKLKNEKFISISFTPLYLFKYNIYQENKFFFWGGIIYGKYF